MCGLNRSHFHRLCSIYQFIIFSVVLAGRSNYVICHFNVTPAIATLNKTGHISLLPQFSEILLNIYLSRLMAFIDSNQILYKSQQ